jgi:5'-nucleotidase (lipoprotein e(P4) family)
MLDAVLWMRRSGEYEGLCLQAYRTARSRLDQALADPAAWHDAVPSTNPTATSYAVIVDVDETILDNTPELAEVIRKDRHVFDDAIWKAWESKGAAASLPGAVEFLTYAAGRPHVDVYYVTNRDQDYKAQLFQNLKNNEFPVSMDRILVQGEYPLGDSSSNKEGRRRFIAATHRILLEMGDDLGDFFDTSGLDADGRVKAVRNHADSWGREWILLPNPAYGGWERAFYPPAERDPNVILRMKRKALEQ